MKNYRVVKMCDKNTGAVLYWMLLIKENTKWFGLAEGDKIKEFKSRKEANSYGENL